MRKTRAILRCQLCSHSDLTKHYFHGHFRAFWIPGFSDFYSFYCCYQMSIKCRSLFVCKFDTPISRKTKNIARGWCISKWTTTKNTSAIKLASCVPISKDVLRNVHDGKVWNKWGFTLKIYCDREYLVSSEFNIKIRVEDFILGSQFQYDDVLQMLHLPHTTTTSVVYQINVHFFHSREILLKLILFMC